MKKKHISILGCGWLGLPLAEHLVAAGHRVMGSTTTLEKMNLLSRAGIRPFLIELEQVSYRSKFFTSDVLIVAVPPKLRSQSPDVYLQQMKNAVIAARESGVSKVIFISSTSVYPDLNREVIEEDVDEETTIAQAEQLFLSEKAFTSSVIRFAGLVGPGRHPGKFLSGKRTAGGDNPVNVIHLDDCIGITLTLMEAEKPLIVNGCADLHPSKREYYTQAAMALNVEPPVFDEGDGSSYKIVSNAFLRKELGYKFLFPDPMAMSY